MKNPQHFFLIHSGGKKGVPAPHPSGPLRPHSLYFFLCKWQGKRRHGNCALNMHKKARSLKIGVCLKKNLSFYLFIIEKKVFSHAGKGTQWYNLLREYLSKYIKYYKNKHSLGFNNTPFGNPSKENNTKKQVKTDVSRYYHWIVYSSENFKILQCLPCGK